jgi:hypothetical protein
MKTRLFFLATLSLLVLLSVSSTPLARQDQQGRTTRVPDVQQPADAGALAPLDVVDGKFNKTLPVVLSLKNCGENTVELKGTCHIEGSIESTGDSLFSMAADASIDLSGFDDSTSMPYKVSLVRQVKNHLDQSNFDVIYYQIPSDGENVSSFTIRLKFADGRISLVSAKAKGCL